MTLDNPIFTLTFNPKGAELKSVFDKRFQKNILYDGLSPHWNRSAPVLFPIVGRLKHNKYEVNKQEFILTQHGFARDLEFEVVKKTNELVQFELVSSAYTKEHYPFDFILTITYELLENTVKTSYSIFNPSKEELLFSIGAHPGFICPVHEDETFEDYYLEFENNENTELTRHLLDVNSGVLNGAKQAINLVDHKLPLSYDLFQKDAIVLKDLKSNVINLKSTKSAYSLRFSFSGFPFFGIWSKPQAPFICLEPWCGVADSIEVSGKLEEKEGIIKLKTNDKFERSYSFEVFNGI